ncbi:hypothetical protein DW757_15440 [Clostridium sp. AM29-11AC]|nr:hypothetical protein DW757_15440 [Clostridium sp. AM29-11AC]
MVISSLILFFLSFSFLPHLYSGDSLFRRSAGSFLPQPLSLQADCFWAKYLSFTGSEEFPIKQNPALQDSRLKQKKPPIPLSKGPISSAVGGTTLINLVSSALILSQKISALSMLR